MTRPDDHPETIPPRLAEALSGGRWRHLLNANPADLPEYGDDVEDTSPRSADGEGHAET